MVILFMIHLKYKGKDNNGNWHYGQLLKEESGFIIITSPIEWRDSWEFKIDDFHYVVEDSIGQFTGMKDKDGIAIYGGDTLVRKYGAIGKAKMKVFFNELNGMWMAKEVSGDQIIQTAHLYKICGSCSLIIS